MLDVDVDGIEAGGLGDARDLDRAHQAHGHRRHDLAARELVLYVVAHDFPRRCGHGVPLRGKCPPIVCSRARANSWPDRTTNSDRKSTRLNSSHRTISYAVFCLKKKKQEM